MKITEKAAVPPRKSHSLNGSAALSAILGVSSLMYLTGKKPPDILVAIGLLSSVVILANDISKVISPNSPDV